MLGKWFATVLISQSPHGFLLAFHQGWNCEFVHFSEHLKKTFKLSIEFLVVHWNRVIGHSCESRRQRCLIIMPPKVHFCYLLLSALPVMDLLLSFCSWAGR